MDSKYIVEVFEDYLKTKKTNYALLINGAWGSGKTHFWKNTLTEKISINEFKPIYISLNGIKKIEDLKYTFLIKLVPFLNKLDTKKGNLLKTIITTVSSGLGNININEILKEIEIDSEKLSQYIVCFDDLERCNIPKDEVLGFINNYVEHKNLKVVILSNEKEISENKEENKEENNSKKYHIIKEKVIGRILNYKNNLNEILPIIFNEYKDDKNFTDFLDSKKESIYNLLSEYKVENLRHLIFFINNLKKIFPFVKTHINYLDEVVFFTLIISLEFKGGFLKSNDYENFNQLDEINPIDAFFDFNINFDNTQSEETVTERTINYSETFYDKYLTNNIELYNFYKSIYTFVLTGYLNSELLSSELDGRYPIKIPSEITAFQSIATNNYLTISDEEFKKLSHDVLNYSKQGLYRIYDYLQISNFYNHFIEKKLIEISIETLNEILITGINKAKEKEEINNRLHNSLFHVGTNERNKIIIDEIDKVHNELLLKLESEETNQLIEAIEQNETDEIDEIFESYLANPKLFELISSESLYKALINSENKTLYHFNIILRRRYSSSNIADFLYQDKALLSKLNKLLNEYIEKNEITIKTHNLKELNSSVSKIIEKLQKKNEIKIVGQ